MKKAKMVCQRLVPPNPNVRSNCCVAWMPPSQSSFTPPGTKVTEAGLVHLKHIDYLNLGGIRVSEKGLAQLKEFKHLKGLYLDNGVTPADLATLQKALPNCDIGAWWKRVGA